MNQELDPAAIPTGSIVVGLDANDTWQDAVDWAADQALLERRDVTLVHVTDTAEDLWHDTGGHDTRLGVKETATVAERAPSLTVHAVLRGGGLRDSLHSTAHEAHVLVVGTRHHEPLWSRLFGTVGSGVARRPPCPVVESEQHLKVAEAVAGLRETYPDVPVRTSVERGEPVSTILRPGTLMNLTVLGAHHGPLVTDLLRGSVVSPVVQQAPSPVAVVPEIPPPGTRSTS